MQGGIKQDVFLAGVNSLAWKIQKKKKKAWNQLTWFRVEACYIQTDAHHNINSNNKNSNSVFDAF